MIGLKVTLFCEFNILLKVNKNKAKEGFSSDRAENLGMGLQRASGQK